MKSQKFFATLLVSVMFFLAACNAVTPTPPPLVAPMPVPLGGAGDNLPTPTIITWSAAESLILSGDVQQVVQTHSRQVTLIHKDGRSLLTTESAIDDVFKVIQKCGAKCANIALATE